MLFVEQACEKVWGMRFPDSGEVTVNLGSERKDEGENGQVVVLADGGEEVMGVVEEASKWGISCLGTLRSHAYRDFVWAVKADTYRIFRFDFLACIVLLLWIFSVAMRLEKFSSMTTWCWRTLQIENLKPMKTYLKSECQNWFLNWRGFGWNFLTRKYLQTDRRGGRWLLLRSLGWCRSLGRLWMRWGGRYQQMFRWGVHCSIL